MIKTILTHPGGAHKDDLLAVCLLAARTGAPVVRRSPTQADLDDPSIAIVDVGGVHDPARANYDHHHFPREHPPTCALSLVLEGLGLYDQALKHFEWLETAEWFDARGPKKTAEWLGVPRQAISQLNSPVDTTLLRRFSQKTALDPSDPLYTFMAMVGQDMLDELRLARERMVHLDAHGQVWDVAHGDTVIPTLFLPRTEPMLDEGSKAIDAWIRAKGLEDHIAATVYPDRRGSGYGVSRYEDHPQLDFSRVEDQPDVHFAHKSGFVCKTTATEPARLQALVRGAWIAD